MKLGTKINLVLVAVVAVTLTIAFWVIINIEGANLKQQVVNDAATVTDILRLDIERMFNQIHAQELSLQNNIDEMSKIPGVSYINVTDANNTYIATTDHSLVGKGLDSADIAIINELKRTRASFDKRVDAGTFYNLERHIPIFANANDQKSALSDAIEVEVTTRSKSDADIADAEKLLDTVVTSINQGTRAIITTTNTDSAVLQEITDGVGNSNLLNHIVVFGDQLQVIANTGGNKNEFTNDESTYKQLRENVLAGKNPVGEVERQYNGVSVIMRVVPIVEQDERTGVVKNIGLIEVHILKQSYEARITELEVRMLGVGIIFTVLLVVVLAIILEREVIGPLRRYSVVAKKIADGDLNQTVEYKSSDEIGEFGSVFNAMVANLRELDKMKSDFISVAAHQLRTPLAGIKWVLKLLLDGDLGSINEDQKGMVVRGYETSEKMTELVDSLLNVSRIENSKFAYKIEKNSFMELVKTLMDNTVLPSKERNIEVRLENHIGEIPDFSFDREKLLTAIQNIVDNAMKYTLPGGRVTVGVDKKGDYLEIKVSDTGVGIPKAEIPKLFSKFFRAANVIHLQTEGSGLGLFIVKSIIVRHGGQIWVDSEEGKGTTISVLIPVLDELIPREEVHQIAQVEKAQEIARG